MYSPPRRSRSYPGRVRLRRPRPESLLAWAAAAVGVIGIVSALTPDMRDRLHLVARRAAARRDRRRTRRCARVRHRARLALALARQSPAPRLAARRRRRHRVRRSRISRRASTSRRRSSRSRSSRRSCGTARRFDVPGEPGADAAAARYRRCGRCDQCRLRSASSCTAASFPDRLSDLFTALGLLLGFAALYPLAAAAVARRRPDGGGAARRARARRRVRARQPFLLRVATRQELFLLADAATRFSPTASSRARR